MSIIDIIAFIILAVVVAIGAYAVYLWFNLTDDNDEDWFL